MGAFGRGSFRWLHCALSLISLCYSLSFRPSSPSHSSQRALWSLHLSQGFYHCLLADGSQIQVFTRMNLLSSLATVHPSCIISSNTSDMDSLLSPCYPYMLLFQTSLSQHMLLLFTKLPKAENWESFLTLLFPVSP